MWVDFVATREHLVPKQTGFSVKKTIYIYNCLESHSHCGGPFPSVQLNQLKLKENHLQ